MAKSSKKSKGRKGSKKSKGRKAAKASKVAKMSDAGKSVEQERTSKRVVLVTKLEDKANRMSAKIDRATDKGKRFDAKIQAAEAKVEALKKDRISFSATLANLGEDAEELRGNISEKLVAFDQKTGDLVTKANERAAKKAARLAALRAKVAELVD